MSASRNTVWEAVMKNMTLGAFAFACALALVSTPGHALTFDFSFTNVSGDTPGTVTGVIAGLVDNATSQASLVIIESVPSVLPIPTPRPLFPGFALSNSFTVVNGTITSALYNQLGVGFPEGMFSLGINFNPPTTNRAELDVAINVFPLTSPFVIGPISFTPVPGPIAGAGLPGLILACGALLALARRRRQLVA
jgi:hypothetical protein